MRVFYGTYHPGSLHITTLNGSLILLGVCWSYFAHCLRWSTQATLNSSKFSSMASSNPAGSHWSLSNGRGRSYSPLGISAASGRLITPRRSLMTTGTYSDSRAKAALTARDSDRYSWRLTPDRGRTPKRFTRDS